MEDHDLLIRIDERVDALYRLVADSALPDRVLRLEVQRDETAKAAGRAGAKGGAATGTIAGAIASVVVAVITALGLDFSVK